MTGNQAPTGVLLKLLYTHSYLHILLLFYFIRKLRPLYNTVNHKLPKKVRSRKLLLIRTTYIYLFKYNLK